MSDDTPSKYPCQTIVCAPGVDVHRSGTVVMYGVSAGPEDPLRVPREVPWPQMGADIASSLAGMAVTTAINGLTTVMQEVLAELKIIRAMLEKKPRRR